MHQPAGIVHAGEFVFSQASVNNLGVGYLDDLHRSGVRGYADGGPVLPLPARPANSNEARRAVNITVVNQSSQPVSAEHGTDANGDPMITLRDLMRGIVVEDTANNGVMSKAFAARARGFGGR